jgi:hypothetical protein
LVREKEMASDKSSLWSPFENVSPDVSWLFCMMIL